MTYERYQVGRTNGNRSAQDIQSDIQDIRGEMSQTLDDISARLQPDELIGRLVGSVKGRRVASKVANSVVHAVQENPVPIAIMAAGFAYLLYSDSQRRHRARGVEVDIEVEPLPEEHWTDEFGNEYSEAGAMEGARQQATGAASTVKHKAGEARGRAREKARQLSDRSSQWASQASGAARRASGKVQQYSDQFSAQASEAAHRAGATARQVRGQASDAAKRAARRGQQIAHEQPMVLAGLGIALGAAIAGAAPVSRKEREWMGEPSRKAMDALKASAEQAKQTASAAAQAAMEAAKKEVSAKASPPGHEGGGETQQEPHGYIKSPAEAAADLRARLESERPPPPAAPPRPSIPTSRTDSTVPRPDPMKPSKPPFDPNR